MGGHLMREEEKVIEIIILGRSIISTFKENPQEATQWFQNFQFNVLYQNLHSVTSFRQGIRDAVGHRI